MMSKTKVIHNKHIFKKIFNLSRTLQLWDQKRLLGKKYRKNFLLLNSKKLTNLFLKSLTKVLKNPIIKRKTQIKKQSLNQNHHPFIYQIIFYFSGRFNKLFQKNYTCSYVNSSSKKINNETQNNVYFSSILSLYFIKKLIKKFIFSNISSTIWLIILISPRTSSFPKYKTLKPYF
jgi:hypothetical protein